MIQRRVSGAIRFAPIADQPSRRDAASAHAEAATRRDLALLAAAALVVLAATAAFTWSRAVDDTSSWDVPLYQSFGDRMTDGQVPYRDFRVEYPPGALPAFLLPSLVASGAGPVYEPELNGAAHAYARAFATLMTFLLAATVVLTAVALAALRVTIGHAAVALGLVGATPLLLGQLALTRFDALPVALTAASIAALLHGRSRLAGIALGLAITAKLYPLLLVPLVALYVWRRRGRREAWLSVGLAAATVAVAILPFVAIAPSEAWFSIRRPAVPRRPGREPPGQCRDRARSRRRQGRPRDPRRRRRRGRHRRGAERRRDGHARAGGGHARRPRGGGGGRRRVARGVAASYGGRRRPLRDRAARPSSPRSSPSAACSRRSSSSGSSRSSRS